MPVPVKLFEENRQRLCEALEATALPPNAYVYLEGGKPLPLYNTDIEYAFRQEPFFMWTFGIPQPSLHGFIHVKTKKSYLFIPRIPSEYHVWIGEPPNISDYKIAYNLDFVYYTDEMSQIIRTFDHPTFLVLNGVNTDSGLAISDVKIPDIENMQYNNEILYDVISECRVIKTELELEVMRYVSRISSEAHKEVMRLAAPGRMEYELEAAFLNYVYAKGGCRHVSYTCICGTGANAAILHYGHEGAPNDKQIKDGDICLMDMGGNYFGYASDITCSFPANGKFTDKQKLIYNAVLDSRTSVLNALRENVSWVDMHKLANRVLLTHLVRIGILKGDVDKMILDEIPACFQPHGLGHLIGLDVHDVGGYLKTNPERPTNKSLKGLRTARILKAGMVLTVEPGCYFIPSVSLVSHFV